MKIGSSQGLDMIQLLLSANNRNRPIANRTANKTTGLPPIQPRPTLGPAIYGVTTSVPPGENPTEYFRRTSWQGNLTQIEMSKQLRMCSRTYAEMFLHGLEGMEMTQGLGVSVFQQRLREHGIELPENVRFDISVNSFGRVTITGLDDAELTSKIENALSYDASFVNSVLSTFTQSAKILAGTNTTQGRNGLSANQFFKIQVHSFLMDLGSGLDKLSLDSNGSVQGLSQELHDKIFRDLGEINSDEQYRLLILQHNIPALLRTGLDNIPAPNVDLTFDSGRMIVNNVGTVGGINIMV